MMKLGTLAFLLFSCLALSLSCLALSLSEHLDNYNNGGEVYEPKLLSTSVPICNNKTNLPCPISDFDQESRLTFCGFSCPQHKKYHCKKDEHHGRIEFCAKSEICDKGHTNSVYFDEAHKSVVIKKAICPEGFFQPIKQDCYTACTEYRHIDKDDLPDLGIVVLYDGNITNPGIGYCDVENDYVNVESNMYINLTQYLYKVNVCLKKDEIQVKCAADQRLLPDSTCASICEKGYVADKENFFTCSNQSSIISVIHKSSTEIPSISSSTKVPNISGISPSKHVTTATILSTTAQQNGAGMNIGWIIGFSVGGFFIIIICLIVWFCRRRKNRNEGGHNSRNNHEGNCKTIKGRRVYVGGEFSKLITTNGDIHVTIGERSANKLKLMKQPSTDNGIEIESDEESVGTISLESGYDTVQSGQQIPGQGTQTRKETEV